MAQQVQGTFTRHVRTALLGIALASVAPAQLTTRVSVGASGVQADSHSATPSFSADGRYVAFASAASNLVPGDTNGSWDIFVHDRQLGVTTRVSVDSAGGQADWNSFQPSISGDGRYVAFLSGADNLVPGDTNHKGDLFVHDCQTGVTTRVTVDSSGAQADRESWGPSISYDGRYVAFVSEADNLCPNDDGIFPDIFVHDRQFGSTTRVNGFGGSPPDGWSDEASISSDGRYVVYSSWADYQTSQGSNGGKTVYVYDIQLGTNSDVSGTGVYDPHSIAGTPAISADGRYVAFCSNASNLVPADVNNANDVFLRDRQTGLISLVSVDSSGAQGNNNSPPSNATAISISADGRYVAFTSLADNLVAGDSNLCLDTFLHDCQGGQTTRISLDSTGLQADGQSQAPSLSLNSSGFLAAFTSSATNLVPGDTNAFDDVFVRDLGASGPSTTRVSIPTDGSQGSGPSSAASNSISADGRYIAFLSDATNLVGRDTNGFTDVFVYDQTSGLSTCVSVDSAGVQADNYSYAPCISADGRYVAFGSYATNLVPGDTNGKLDIFVHDRVSGLTSRASVDSAGAEADADSFGLALSANGRYVAFGSAATNLVQGDTNGVADIFLHDNQNGLTTLVSVDSNGFQADLDCYEPSISADGRFVAFSSAATNLVAGDTNGVSDVFVQDRQSGYTIRVSVDASGAEGNASSSMPSISADGRIVAFYSTAANLVPGDTNAWPDIFAHDSQSGLTTLVSVDSLGAQSDAGGYDPSISADGQCVAFSSTATNLVAGDTNAAWDVFVHESSSGLTRRVSVDSAGTQGNFGSFKHSISADGRYVAFDSDASDLVAGDTNALKDVFVHDRGASNPGTDMCQPGVAGVLACPCGNPPANAPRGCDNSSATGGAQLTSSGLASLANDTLLFVTNGERPSKLSLLLQGDAVLPLGATFGQGVRCVGGSTRRLFWKTSSGGSITAPEPGDPSISARSAAVSDPISAGTSRWYAVYYRDPVVLGSCPSTNSFNITQTQQVVWGL